MVKALQAIFSPSNNEKCTSYPSAPEDERMARAEGIVDLATNLRQLAALAYQNTENSREEEIVEQFIRALDTKELRVSMNQSDPKTLDEAVNVSLKLESIHLAVIQNNSKINMAEMLENHIEIINRINSV